MKTNKLNRRRFLAQSARITGTGCLLLITGGKWISATGRETLKPDPKKLNYCGYQCPDDCKLFQATLQNDTELKKEAWKMWRIEEKYGLAFDPEQVKCYTCKSDHPNPGVVVDRCSVRLCALEKNFDCCIECEKLSTCDKEIWSTFPEFHKSVIDMQARFQES